jgi:hypothetical protein
MQSISSCSGHTARRARHSSSCIPFAWTPALEACRVLEQERFVDAVLELRHGRLTATGETHDCLAIGTPSVTRLWVGQFGTGPLGQLLNHRFHPPQPVHLTTRSRHLLIKLLTDALDSTALTAVADSFSRLDEGASDLPSLALPATLGALADFPSLERGRPFSVIAGTRVFHFSSLSNEKAWLERTTSPGGNEVKVRVLERGGDGG